MDLSNPPLPSPAPAADGSASALVTASLRNWRHARDHGLAVQPCLAAALDAADSVMLAPVLDSLFSFCEAALARPLAAGDGALASEDERLVLRLIRRPQLCDSALDCPAGLARGLACALCSTRIMLARTLQ